MFQYINSKEILNTSEYVREPVDDVCKKIENSFSKKIILCGGRGTGKSIVLSNNEKRSVGRENQSILTNFDLAIINRLTSDEVFNKDFFEHYYEISISNKLLNYIKQCYKFTYETHFNDLEKIVNNFLKDIDNYINKVYYEKVSLSKYLKTGELSYVIYEKLKKCLDITSLSFSIDRFDWINGNSEMSQIILSKYFDMFDKVIISSDDDELQNESNRKKLIEKGYSFIDVDYGKNDLIIKEIIKRRIEQYNKFKNTCFQLNLITDEMYKFLINKTNGNINLMLDSVSDLIDIWYFKEGVLDLQQQLSNSTEEQIQSSIKLKKMCRPPKLYL